MDAVEKKKLSIEAEMQINALKKINWWKTVALAFSTIGVTLAYVGMSGESHNLFLGVPGIILIVAGIVSAIVLNLGLKNGRRNVEKILDILET